MKRYHYMDDAAGVCGPVELGSLAKYPPDTLVREIGTTKWIALRLARKAAGGLAEPVADKASAAGGMDPWATAILVAGIGFILGGYMLAVRLWFPALIGITAFCAGLSAMVSLATGLKPKLGYMLGAVFGPLGLTVTLVMGIVKIAQK